MSRAKLEEFAEAVLYASLEDGELIDDSDIGIQIPGILKEFNLIAK